MESEAIKAHNPAIVVTLDGARYAAHQAHLLPSGRPSCRNCAHEHRIADCKRSKCATGDELVGHGKLKVPIIWLREQ